MKAGPILLYSISPCKEHKGLTRISELFNVLCGLELEETMSTDVGKSGAVDTVQSSRP